MVKKNVLSFKNIVKTILVLNQMLHLKYVCYIRFTFSLGYKRVSELRACHIIFINRWRFFLVVLIMQMLIFYQAHLFGGNLDPLLSPVGESFPFSR